MHTIDQLHEQWMRQMCLLDPGEPLPVKLVDKYRQLQRLLDRIGEPVKPSDIARFCVELGFSRPLGEMTTEPTPADLMRRGKLPAESPVLVKWRGKDTAAKLIRITSSNQCVVILESEVEERTVDVNRVSLPVAA